MAYIELGKYHGLKKESSGGGSGADTNRDVGIRKGWRGKKLKRIRKNNEENDMF